MNNNTFQTPAAAIKVAIVNVSVQHWQLMPLPAQHTALISAGEHPICVVSFLKSLQIYTINIQSHPLKQCNAIQHAPTTILASKHVQSRHVII